MDMAGCDILVLALPFSDGLLRLTAAVALMAFVSVLVVAVFGQRGQAEMTPEREVALATGHADRHTVFEMAGLQPLMWLLLSLARTIQARQLKLKLRRILVAAGSPNFYTADEYLAVAMLWGLVGAAVLEGVNILVARSVSYTLPLVGFLAGTAAAIYWLHTRAAKRVREISRRMPYTLDLIALAMGAGATFTEAVRTVVHEDPDHPFNVELNSVLAEIDLGNTRRDALKNLADRVPLENLRSIIAAIIQAESLGTPLSDVLKQQATLLRLQRSVRAEKLAAAASVRILLPSLLIMMSVVLAVFAPIIIRAIRGELY
ncbi:MAG: hypothetical protein AMJ81_02380 [Phycisphaerae bacterium SM23_33]|jgi:tight adherence protein C|nr:MAG: hypothetical protein AMJ81_02380 [Phycisphaerae bacterium SM23_33]